MTPLAKMEADANDRINANAKDRFQVTDVKDGGNGESRRKDNDGITRYSNSD